MTSVYDLKPKFQTLLRPACRQLAHRSISANQVTLFACATSILYGAWIWFSGGAPVTLIFLPLFLFIRMGLNAIDGILAREFGMKSKLGAILNELTDVIADTALYLPFLAINGISHMPLIFFVCLAIITEMTGIIGIQIGAARRYDGPFGKSDRASAFGLLAFLLGVGLIQPGRVTDIFLWLSVVLSIVTIANRARQALHQARQEVH
ncbi:MAG: CDP-alcohol phosphatidyltransferase family protein [bacterium]